MSRSELLGRSLKAIESAYESLGHTLGWRFLTSRSETFVESQAILLLTLNPAGTRDDLDHPREACEAGSAYIVESWDGRPPGQAKLQQQIRLMFGEIAHRLVRVQGDDLLTQSMSAHFVPFRSPTFDSLHERERSISFAKELWTDILGHINPRIIITLSKEAYSAVVEIESKLKSATPLVVAPLIGWGRYRANVARFPEGPVVCWLPHLSRYSIFGRADSATQVREIMDLILMDSKDAGACELGGVQRDTQVSQSEKQAIEMAVAPMKKIYVVSKPSKPFRAGTARSRAWYLLQAFDGLSEEAFVRACAVLEHACDTGGDPAGWVKFFTSTGRYRREPGNPNASETLAEVRD